MMNILPLAKNSEVVIQDLKGELLVYDLRRDKAFCLNETAKIVYQACDGKTTFNELKKKHKFTDDLICLALDELSMETLIEGEPMNYFGSLSRREAVKKVGLATLVALPVIASLVAPVAAQAQSSSNGECAPTTEVPRPAGEVFGLYTDPAACQLAGTSNCCSGMAHFGMCVESVCQCVCN